MAHHAKASEKIRESFEKVRESFEGIRLVLERGFESVGISGVLTAAGGAISIEELIKTSRWLLEGLFPTSVGTDGFSHSDDGDTIMTNVSFSADLCLPVQVRYLSLYRFKYLLQNLPKVWFL
jgi:hypothetical protein